MRAVTSTHPISPYIPGDATDPNGPFPQRLVVQGRLPSFLHDREQVRGLEPEHRECNMPSPTPRFFLTASGRSILRMSKLT